MSETGGDTAVLIELVKEDDEFEVISFKEALTYYGIVDIFQQNMQKEH